MNNFPLAHANVIKLLNVGTLPLDEKMAILDSAAELVETRTLNRVLEKLDDADKAVFRGALESEDAITVGEMLEKSAIDLMAITEEEIERVKHELLADAKEPIE